MYTLNVLLTSKLNNDWTDHIAGMRSMNARWHIQKSLEALDRTMKDPRSTPVDELNACLTFDRFRFFFCYCKEKVLIKEKIKKSKRKIRKFKNT